MNELPDDKIIECKKIFDMFDLNKDGAISSSELGLIMKSMGVNPTDAELKEMIAEMDSNHSKEIEFQEFLDLYASKMKDPDIEEDLIEAFKIFDKTGKGYLTAQELKIVMTTLGDPCSEEEAGLMIHEGDFNSDGKIDYMKFVKYMMTKKK